MKKLKSIIQEREFLKFFLMFFSGTLLAQLITIGISPLLTRIYTPEDFGVYGVYISIVSLLIVFVTGRYEYAINNAELEEDAISLYKIVNYLSISSSGFIFIILFFFNDLIVTFFRLNISSKLLYLIPLTLLFMGLLQSSSYYLNRHKKFPTLSKSKVYRSVGIGVGSLTAGLMGFGAIGLILGNIIGTFISQFYQRINEVRGKVYNPSWLLIKRNLVKHKNYPIYNAPSAFFDNLAMQAPVFILLKFFSESIVGFYSLTMRVIGMPIGLIATSISQVFLSQVSELHRNNKSYKKVIIKTAQYLALIGLVPLIILSFFGPSLFSLAFGENWVVAGEFAQILTIGYYFKFIVSPLSIVFFINKRIILLSKIQTIRAFSTGIILITFSVNFSSINTVLLAYTIHEVVFYLIYFYYILKTSE